VILSEVAEILRIFHYYLRQRRIRGGTDVPPPMTEKMDKFLNTTLIFSKLLKNDVKNKLNYHD